MATDDHSLLVGDLISVAGIFRDGMMDESREHIAENVQHWRVAVEGGALLLPVLPTGEPDVESYWFGRSTGFHGIRGRYGVVSQPTLAGRN